MRSACGCALSTLRTRTRGLASAPPEATKLVMQLRWPGCKSRPCASRSCGLLKPRTDSETGPPQGGRTALLPWGSGWAHQGHRCGIPSPCLQHRKLSGKQPKPNGESCEDQSCGGPVLRFIHSARTGPNILGAIPAVHWSCKAVVRVVEPAALRSCAACKHSKAVFTHGSVPSMFALHRWVRPRWFEGLIRT